MHVKFNVPNQNTDGNVDPLLANDIFVHYFAESELEECIGNEGIEGQSSTVKVETAPFDGMSCKTFKLDKLKMGQQAQRIAAFEEQNRKSRDSH